MPGKVVKIGISKEHGGQIKKTTDLLGSLFEGKGEGAGKGRVGGISRSGMPLTLIIPSTQGSSPHL